MTRSRDLSHFASLYASDPDPWDYHHSPYEHTKYRKTLSTLGSRRFRAGLEVGCSIGILTRQLAGRCDRVLAIDLLQQPLDTARNYCADLHYSVRFAQARVPDHWPSSRHDLIVLSEVLYFLTPKDIDRCAARVRDSLLPRGRVLLVNWLGKAGDPTTGNIAAQRFIAHSHGALRQLQQKRQENYRIDLLCSAN